MYKKTIIKFGFCDIRNNQGLIQLSFINYSYYIVPYSISCLKKDIIFVKK